MQVYLVHENVIFRLGSPIIRAEHASLEEKDSELIDLSVAGTTSGCLH